MKKGWEKKKIADICTIERGGSPRPIKKYLTNDEKGINWIKIGDTDPQGKYIYSTAEKIIPEGLKRSRWVDVDEFLLSNSMSFGRPYILKTNGCIHDGWLVLRKYQEHLNIDFFYYLLSSPLVQRQFKTKAQGSTVSNLNTQRVSDVTVYIPPLSEQKEIVEYLDSSFAKIDKLKENAAKNLEEAKALFQSALKDALEPKEGWEEKTLKEIGITQTGTTPSKSDSANYGNYMEFIRPSEIDFNGMGGINYNCELKLSEQGASNGRVFEEKSILMVCIGATIGKVGFSNKKISCNQQINVLTPSSEYDYKFVYYSMKSPRFQKMVIKEGTSSQATLPIINKGKWEKLTVQVPSLQEQQSIVSFLDSLSEKLNTLQQNYSRICDECDALKQAILRQVFE